MGEPTGRGIADYWRSDARRKTEILRQVPAPGPGQRRLIKAVEDARTGTPQQEDHHEQTAQAGGMEL
jgi:hypothetical protein